jgi:hypothetical protein
MVSIRKSVANNSNKTVTDTPITSNTDIKNGDPIAIPITESWLKYQYTATSNVAAVRCSYKIGTSGTFTSVTASARTGEFNINTPPGIGKYTLQVRFEFFSDANRQNSIGSKTVTHDLYVLFGKPRSEWVTYTGDNYNDANTEIPRIAWLDFAMRFAQGKQPDASSLMNALTSGVYSNPYNWEYGKFFLTTGVYAIGYPAWLIERRKPSSAEWSTWNYRVNCKVMRDILRILANSIGIPSIESASYEPGGTWKCYLTKDFPPAFDNVGMNAYHKQNNYASRWALEEHLYVKRGGIYYDPTFNVFGSTVNYEKENVYARTTPESGGKMYTLEGKEIKCSLGFLYGGENFRGWQKLNYEEVSISAPSISAANNLSVQDRSFNIEKMDYRLLDEDSNGLAEWLAVDMLISTDSEFDGHLIADLYAANGDSICRGSLTPDIFSSMQTNVHFDATNSQKFSAYFNGRQIRDAKKNGPYRMHIQFVDDYGNLFSDSSEAWLTTMALTSDAFQSNLLRIISINDDLVNQGETIRFLAAIDAEKDGTYMLSGSLFKDNGEEQIDLGAYDQEIFLAVGSNQIQFDFNATKIRGENISGPYHFYLNAKDNLYADWKDHVSANYGLDQLVPPAAYIEAPLSYDNSEKITVSVPLMVTMPDTYILGCSIWDNDCNLIDVNNVQTNLPEGSSNIQIVFDFDNVSVLENDLEYPYTALVVVIDEDENLLARRTAEINGDLNIPTSIEFVDVHYNAQIPTANSTTTTVIAHVLDQFGNILPNCEVTYSINPAYVGVTINSSSGLITIQSSADAGAVNIVASYGTLTPTSVLLTLSSAATYTVYLMPEKTALNIGETLHVNVVLVGSINYTQLVTEIVYNTDMLEFVGYQYLRGWAASVTESAPEKIAVRSVPGMNMVIGEPCKNDAKIVTLKFMIKDIFSEDSIDTDLSFASVLVSPPGGVVGTTTASGEPVTITLYQQ